MRADLFAIVEGSQPPHIATKDPERRRQVVFHPRVDGTPRRRRLIAYELQRLPNGIDAIEHVLEPSGGSNSAHARPQHDALSFVAEGIDGDQYLASINGKRVVPDPAISPLVGSRFAYMHRPRASVRVRFLNLLV